MYQLKVAGWDKKVSRCLGIINADVYLQSYDETQKVSVELNVMSKSPFEMILGKNFLNQRAILDFVGGNVNFFSNSGEARNNSLKSLAIMNRTAEIKKVLGVEDGEESHKKSTLAKSNILDPKDDILETEVEIATASDKTSADKEKFLVVDLKDYMLESESESVDDAEEPIAWSGDRINLRTTEDNANRLSVLNQFDVDSNYVDAINPLLVANRALFEQSNPMKFINNHFMKIETITDKPISERARVVKPADAVEMEKQVGDLLEKGIVVKSASSWSFPTVLVQKSDGSRRLCVDYRRLNKVTIADRYPLPRIDSILASHGGKSIFSLLDLKNGFHQLAVHPGHRQKTAFQTHFGLFEYVGAPFGLTNTPSAFQRVMDEILEPVKDFCRPYVDDLLISSTSLAEHVQHLDKVFACLSANNVHLNVKKCKFGRSQVTVLGHVLDSNGIRPCSIKIRNITDFKRPENKKGVQEFLGMVTYVARFFPQLPSEVLVLRKLIRKGSNYVWNREQEEAFQTIKEIVNTQTSLVHFPDSSFKKIINIEADRSIVACVVYQVNGKAFELLDSRSAALSETETRYNAIEREALALRLALQKCKLYLEGSVEVRTRLCHFGTVIKRSLLPARLTRILLDCQEIQFEVVYDPSMVRLLTVEDGVVDEIVDAEQKLVEVDETIQCNEPVQTVFVDGSCRGNGSSNAVAGYGVWWGPDDPRNSSGVVEERPSNQSAELYAAVVALTQAIESGIRHLKLVSDSSYLIQSRQQWSTDWKRNGYINRKGKPVAHSGLHQKLDELSSKLCVHWTKVRAHTGNNTGNDMADSLAKDATIKLGNCSAIESTSFIDRVAKEQANDQFIQMIKSQILELKYRDKYVIKDGFLYKKYQQKCLLVVPSNQRSQILQLCHDHPMTGGHRGTFTTFSTITDQFWWKTVRSDTVNYVNSCPECQLFKGSNEKYGKLVPFQVSKVMEQLGIDYIGPMPSSSKGNRFIIIATDYFSKYAFVEALPNCTSEATADFLVNQIFCKFGLPQNILSDQGRQFESRLIQDLLVKLKIDKMRTAPYSPRCNGLCERTNGSLMKSLRNYVLNNPQSWDAYLQLVCAKYNNSYNVATGFCPTEIMFGRSFRQIFKNESSTIQLSHEYYTSELVNRVKMIDNIVQQNAEFAKNKMKTDFDKDRITASFNHGDLILLKNNRTSSKFEQKYFGPYKVIRSLNENMDIEIELDSHRKQIVSVRNVKKYTQRDPSLENEVNIRCENPYDYHADLSFFDRLNGEASYADINEPSTGLEIIEVLDQADNNASSESDETEIYYTGNSDEELVVPETTSRNECSICSKNFLNQSNLKRHMRIHTQHAPYACRYCRRPFIWFTSWKRHENLTHPLEHRCTICGFEFGSAREYLLHRRELHDGS